MLLLERPEESRLETCPGKLLGVGVGECGKGYNWEIPGVLAGSQYTSIKTTLLASLAELEPTGQGIVTELGLGNGRPAHLFQMGWYVAVHRDYNSLFL